MKRTSRTGRGDTCSPKACFGVYHDACMSTTRQHSVVRFMIAEELGFGDLLPSRRSYSLSPELYVRPTTNELDRPIAISPAIDPQSRHVEGALTGKGQGQSEVGPRGTRASARYSRCSRRARGARVSVEAHAPRTEAWVPFERVRVPRGPLNATHFKKASGKPRREPHTREHGPRVARGRTAHHPRRPPAWRASNAQSTEA
jgi:hypothetical protein